MLPEEIIYYARSHGLAIDHRAFNPLDEFLAANPPQLDLDDPPGSTILPDDSEIRSALQERLNVTHNVIHFIAKCIKPRSQAPTVSCDDYKRFKRLRLSPPLLPTDHANDVYEFVAEARREREAQIPLHSLPFEGDFEQDLSWPAHFTTLCEDLNKEIAKEKLNSTREVLGYIRKTINGSNPVAAEKDLVEKDLRYTKKNITLRLSPPLLPLDEVSETYVPPSPALELPLLSDHTDPDAAALEELEKSIRLADRIDIETSDEVDTDKVRKLLANMENPVPCDPFNKLDLLGSRDGPKFRSASKWKLDTPLSPLRNDQETSRPRSGPSTLEGLQREGKQSPVSALKINNFQDLLEDEHLGNMARLALERVDKEIKEEQLSDRHIVPMLAVPDLQPVELNIPWEKDTPRQPSKETSDPHYLLADLFSQYQDNTSHGCSGDSDLRWVPCILPKTNVETRETIADGDHYLVKALKPPSRILQSSELLWKPGKLRVYSGCEEVKESELNEDHVPTVKAPKQGNQIPSDGRLDPFTLGGQQGQSIVPAKRPAPESAEESAPRKQTHPPEQTRNLQPRDEPVSDSISSFMRTRGLAPSNHQNPTTSKFFPKLTPDPPDVPVPSTPKPVTPPIPSLTTPNQPPISPPKPNFVRQYTLILHSSLLSNYSSLVSRLQTIQPHAPRLIFRDPLSIKTPFPTNPDPLPDILVSPTVGILLGNLQSLIQRPLPGQHSSSPTLHSRILSLKDTLACLFVLLASKSAASMVDASSCSSLTELTALGTSLGNDFTMSVILVPPMTPADPAPPVALLDHGKKAPEHTHHLLNWILALTERYGYVTPDGQPTGPMLDEETTWEVWLRAAGLNPFAAQVIAGTVKRQDQGDMENQAEDLCGLRRFVQMGGMEREMCFGPIIGNNITRRLSEAVDFRWNNSPALIDVSL